MIQSDFPRPGYVKLIKHFRVVDSTARHDFVALCLVYEFNDRRNVAMFKRLTGIEALEATFTAFEGRKGNE